jgi:hypothetical protein
VALDTTAIAGVPHGHAFAIGRLRVWDTSQLSTAGFNGTLNVCRTADALLLACKDSKELLGYE